MTKETKILYLVIAGLLITVVLLFIRGEKATNENKILKEQVKTAEQKIKTEEKFREKVNNKLDSLDTKISNTKTTINNITVERDKKVEEVNNYTNADLQQYFDKKYGK